MRSLEAQYRVLGLRPEDAVGRNAEVALQLAHRRTAGTDCEIDGAERPARAGGRVRTRSTRGGAAERGGGQRDRRLRASGGDQARLAAHRTAPA